MLTPLDVYLVMQADNFKNASSALSWACFMLILCLGVVCIPDTSARINKYLITGACCLLLLGISFLTLSVFIPSSQTLGAMYLVPQVVNSKQAQKLDTLSLKVLDLVEHVTDKANEALKEEEE